MVSEALFKMLHEATVPSFVPNGSSMNITTISYFSTIANRHSNWGAYQPTTPSLGILSILDSSD